MIKNLKNLKICIIGVGKVGSALAYELYKKGFNLKYLIDNNLDNLMKFSLVIKNISVSNKITPDFIQISDIIIISVQDKNLEIIVNDLKKTRLDFRNKFIIHTSGFHTSDILLKLSTNFAKIGSFHPVQTFNKISFKNDHLLNGIYWGIEAGKELQALLKKVSGIFNSKYILVPKDAKPIYHFACVYASSFLISYLNVLDKLLTDTNIIPIKDLKIFLPIINRTLVNISVSGSKKSLTGPFVRRDFKVIEGHLKLLKKNIKELIPLYLYFGKSAINLSSNISDSSKKDLNTLKRILNKYEKSFSHKN
jgi:predicted short-subunit dehydrogenase-like oxidoreductase (DUF2520 family)